MQFGRRINLTIGNKKEAVQIIYDESLNQVPNIVAQIKKTIDSEPNICTLAIDNLSANVRNRITSKEFNLLKLDIARNGEDMRTIFVGTIDRSSIQRESASGTSSLVMDCGDGTIAYSDSYVSRTLRKGMTDSEIINELIKEMPEVTRGAMELPKDRVLPRGKTMIGNVRDELTLIALRHKCDWSIQDGKLMFIPHNRVLSDAYGYLISQETGMTGTLQKRGDGGLDVDMFINPSVVVGSLIRVKSIFNEFDGDYRVQEIDYRISSRGADWHQKNSVLGGNYQLIEKEAPKAKEAEVKK